jgi:hypothetical protein
LQLKPEYPQCPTLPCGQTPELCLKAPASPDLSTAIYWFWA